MNLSAFHEHPLARATSHNSTVANAGPSTISNSNAGVSSVLENVGAGVQPVELENECLLEQRHLLVLGKPGDDNAMLLDTTIAETRHNGNVFAFGCRSGQPALTAVLSQAGTPVGLAQGFLRALGDQSALEGTCALLTERLIRRMQQYDVGLMLVLAHEREYRPGDDEGAKVRIRMRSMTARGWLTSLMDRTGTRLILTVMPESLGQVDSDPQFRRRLTRVTALTSFGAPS